MSFCPVDKHFRSRIRVGEEELGFLQLLRQLPHGPPRVITDDLLHPLHHLYAVGITAAPVLLPFLYQSCISICEMPLLLE